MGDAYTAVADDESTLFYNPAALARHRGVTIYPLRTNFEVPDVVDTNLSFDNFSIGLSNQFKDFPKEPEAIANKILGQPLYLQLAGSFGLKFLSTGINFFALSKTELVLENAIHPKLNIDYRLDRGMIVGHAYSFGSGGFGKNPTGHQSSIGLGLKIMNRQGLDNSYNLYGTELLEIIANSDSYKSIRYDLGYSKGSGYGFDLGFEHNYYQGATRYTFGASFLDVGDTSFTKEEGNSAVPAQKQSLNTGLALHQGNSLFNYTLAADLHNLIDAGASFGSKVHLGGRLRLPFLSIYNGWNGGYMSWGVGLRFLFLDLRLGFYGIEAGKRYGQKESERAVISINLAEIGFNAF
jgi:hypothetical protein